MQAGWLSKQIGSVKISLIGYVLLIDIGDRLFTGQAAW